MQETRCYSDLFPVVAMQHQTALQKLANPVFPSMGIQEINDLLRKSESYLQKAIEILLPEVKPEVKTDGK